ncbi:hypothetical protein HDU86_005116 [Geranomyces michiganensis]|nr:hypothetical protein HDU86_005116 [Geranomyces michiganensis]
MSRYPTQPPPTIGPKAPTSSPPKWVEVSTSSASSSDQAEADIAEAAPPPSDLVEKLLLFPTYGRMSLNRAQAMAASEIGKHAAAVPGTPPKSRGSYFGSLRPLSASFNASFNIRNPTPNADIEGGSVIPESDPAAHTQAVNAFAVPGPVEADDEAKWLVNVKGWIYGTRAASKRRKLLLSLSRKFLASSTVDAAMGARHDEVAGVFLATSMKNVAVRVAVTGLAPSDNILALKQRQSSKNLADAMEKQEEIEDAETKELDWAALSAGDGGITLRTDASGFFSGTIQLEKDKVDKWRESRSHLEFDHNFVRVVAFKTDDPELHSLASIELIGPNGVSLISDVDDTIKDSSVHAGRMAAMHAALFVEPKEIEGMADAYNFLRAKQVSVHYVSAAPFQLYPMLSTFLKASKFPSGSLNLRNVWEKEHMSSRAYKHKIITRILQDFPDRKFILVGDSGELDIETYAGLYAVAPERIIKIFIRDVNSQKHALPKARSFPLRTREISSERPPGDFPPDVDPTVNPLVARMHGVYEALQRDAWSLFKLPEAIFTDRVVLDAVTGLAASVERLDRERQEAECTRFDPKVREDSARLEEEARQLALETDEDVNTQRAATETAEIMLRRAEARGE